MNKRVATLLVLLAATHVAATAQFMPAAQSARQSALGGCIVIEPAGETHIGMGWRQGYLTDGLATKTLQATVALGKTGAIYGDYSHFGDMHYHEQQAAAGVGIGLARWLRAGVAAIYRNMGTDDAHYETRHWLDAAVAVEAQLTKRCSATATVESRRWDSTRPVGGHCAIAYRPRHDMLTVVEAAFEEQTRLRCGMEYTYDGSIAARIGLSTNPLIATFGVGYRHRHYHIDLASEVHPVLGLTPQITLGICL